MKKCKMGFSAPPPPRKIRVKGGRSLPPRRHWKFCGRVAPPDDEDIRALAL